MARDAEFYRAFRDQIILSLNTSFPALVLSYNESIREANIQPMFMTKNYNEDPQTQPIVEGVPVLMQRYKVDGGAVQEFVPIVRPGDIVMCVCSQRSLDDVRAGRPYYAGNSRILSLQDAVIIGVI